MKPIKGILVDPFKREVREVDYNGDWRTIKDHIQCGQSPFDVVRFPDGDCVYVDDEGLLKNPTHFFMIGGYEGLLAGRGLFLGCDEEGDTGPLRWVKLPWLRDNVAFFARSTVVEGGWHATHARGFDSMGAFVRALNGY